MEWVQLVLPQEGMLPALLCYRQSFGEDGCIHLQGMTQKIFMNGFPAGRSGCWESSAISIGCIWR